MIINAEKLKFDELNRAVKNAPDKDVTITGALGQRYIGSGVSGKSITIVGTPGNALGAYLNGVDITVNGNVQDAVGDTMNSGKITVHGHAGDTVGYAMRGGEIYVRDYAGFRVGIHMKEYGDNVPKIVIGGFAGDFLGEYQAGGIILVLGIGHESSCPVGAFCATGQYGGKIYIRSRFIPQGLPPQADAEKINDKREIEPLVKTYCDAFGCSFDELINSDYIRIVPSTSNIYKRLYCNRGE